MVGLDFRVRGNDGVFFSGVGVWVDGCAGIVDAFAGRRMIPPSRDGWWGWISGGMTDGGGGFPPSRE